MTDTSENADESRTVLDLFAGLDGFSAAFADSPRWDVVTVDIKERFEPDIQADVLDLRPGDLPDADVVLASPPCEEFSMMQNLNSEHEPDPEAITLVYHSIGLIRALDPDYWFLENPRGRLRTIIGRPTGTVTYCQYGEEHMKPTDLWGEHPTGLTYRACSYGADCHLSNRGGNHAMRDVAGKRTRAERAKVPRELSEAILRSVENVGEQATLTEVPTA